MAIETVLGTNSKLVLVSQSHGSIRVPLNQNFDYTPRYTSKTVFEFDRTDAAISISLYEGTDVRFEHLDTDSKLVDAAINDVDPASAVVVDDPSDYKELNVFLNIKNSLGVIFQSVLAKGVRIKGSATAEPVRDESRITREGEALNVLRVKGGAIEYSRAKTATSTAFAQANANDGSDTDTDEVTTPGSSEYDLANVPETLASGKKYLLALLNGTDIESLDNPPTLVFTGTQTVRITPALGATDVFELFTVYQP
ncbi:MAG: hypothetical protein ABL876_18745 [Chitinophagaceae bacterium]